MWSGESRAAFWLNLKASLDTRDLRVLITTLSHQSGGHCGQPLSLYAHGQTAEQ
jgi:alkaline phosphatase